MIYLDDLAIVQRATNSDKAFHADVQPCNVEAVFLNGTKTTDATYVDLEKGFIIRSKRDVEGKLVVINSEIAQEIVFGDVSVTYREQL